MSDEKTYTEREKVLAERAAWIASRKALGGLWALNGGSVAHTLAIEAASLYPLPKVTRRRGVRDVHDPRITWSVAQGEIIGYDCEHAISHGHSAFIPYARRIEQWSDLLANPTEEVDG